VHVAIDVLYSVVYDLMSIVRLQSIVGQKKVGVERGTGLYMLPHFGLQGLFLPVRHNRGANLATTLKDSENCGLIVAATPGDTFRPLPFMHVARFATNESLVGFNMTDSLSNEPE
jgi:hypothetical protein